MKKIIITIVVFVCITVLLISNIVLEGLSFSEEDYLIYVPLGAPENIWIESELSYGTSKIGFEYTKQLLLDDDYDDFQKSFLGVYEKYRYEDIYNTIRNVFLETKYTDSQANELLLCLEKIYDNEKAINDSLFLTKCNLKLQIELNYKFGRLSKAFELKKTLKTIGEE